MHRNVEVTYRLVFRRCTEKEKKLRSEMKNVEKINERDDIQEECCEFVRHLLWRYISKQNDDRVIDKALNSISSFRSSESVVQSTNPKRTKFDRIRFVFLSNFTRKRLSCNFQYSRNARNTNGQYSFTLK